MFCIGTDDETADAVSPEIDTSVSVFSKIAPKTKINNVAMAPTQHVFAKDGGQKSIKKVIWQCLVFITCFINIFCGLFQYLEAPIHTMVPIRIMCGFLLKSMVLQKSTWSFFCALYVDKRTIKIPDDQIKFW